MIIQNRCRHLLLAAGIAFLTGCGGGGGEASSEPLPVAPGSPLAGQINIEAGSRIDQDTMDELGLSGAQPATSPQSLPLNFVLAGYVSGDSGSYEAISGQIFSYSADASDQFLVPLAPGEVVRLVSLGSRAGNPQLTLTLFDGSGMPPSATTDRESDPAEVTLGDGFSEDDYLLEVEATGSLPARYVLVKASTGQLGSFSLDWPAHEFMPGEAIVRMNSAGSPGLSGQSATPGRHLGNEDWLIKMPLKAAAASTEATKTETLDWIRGLRKRTDVASVSPNYLFSSANTPVGEELYGLQWHYDLINGPEAWQLAPDGGAGVSVAVLDSGLFSPDPASRSWHPDLEDNVLPGRDFVDGDDFPQDPGSSVAASVFHGTHVAGTIGAVLNGQGIGGVAFGGRILPVRVLGEGGTGSSDDLIDAIRWVTGETDGVAARAQVVNLSLGGLPEIPQLEAAIEFGVNERDMLFVGAAGNSATSSPSYPAASPNVLAVSSVDAGGQLASYSNFGSWIDLAGPGGDASRDGNNDGRADVVWSTSAVAGANGFEASYTGLQGTSMAAPHVSGVLALLKTQDSSLNYEGLRALLESGGLTDFSGSRSDQLGFGILDASGALQANLSGDITILSPSPSQVILGSETGSEQIVRLNQIGNGAISNVSISDTPPWFTVIRSDIDSTIALNVALVDSAIEENVAYRDVIRVDYQAGSELRSLDIPVVAQVLSDEFARTAGVHFVLLVNTTPVDGFYEAEAQLAVEPENGHYTFRFESDDGVAPKRLSEVSPGSYYLVAGTDIDGDGVICQPGEACAEYPIAGLREIITIEEGQSLEEVIMTTSFSRPTISASTPDILPRPDFSGYRLLEAGERRESLEYTRKTTR
ncbi:S8 family serine peptidase [Marinobacter adhaerens]|jgi:serine protease|uniref:S8 family serine peptidase n=2 Tax=Marinobacter adhaerens TaxID=1033846 RepID=UPI003D14B119